MLKLCAGIWRGNAFLTVTSWGGLPSRRTAKSLPTTSSGWQHEFRTYAPGCERDGHPCVVPHIFGARVAMDGGATIAVALVSVSAIVGLILLGDWIAAAWAELLFFQPRNQSLRHKSYGDLPAVPSIDLPCRFHDVGDKL